MADSGCDQLEEGLVKEIEQFFNISELKAFQKAVLVNTAVLKNDSLVCAPTGSGKSMCFEALPIIYDRQWADREATTTTTGQSVHATCERAVIILISALVNLINMQVDTLTSNGFSAVSLVGNLDRDVKKNLENCRYRYLVGNPESFLNSEFIRSLLISGVYQKSVSALVFDEVHTAVSWGLSSDGKKAFRSFFSRVGDLRAKFPEVPIMCLTATASKATLSTVRQLLALKKPFEYLESPDRPNIRLCVKKIKTDHEAVHWLIEGIRKYGNKYPKTIVYCRSIRECSELYALCEEHLGKNPVDVDKRHFDMVHSKTMPEVKTGIIDRLMHTTGQLVVVFATKILGMGIDIRCSQVVHYGPPGTVDDYLQQIGRAGRDGEQAHAVLLFHGKQLRNLYGAVRNVVRNLDSCIREILLKDFPGESL